MNTGELAFILASKANKKIKELPNGYRSLGEVTTYNELPSSGNNVGDSYTVRTADVTHKAGRYVWGKSGGILKWYYLDGDNDYATQTELDSKADKDYVDTTIANAIANAITSTLNTDI